MMTRGASVLFDSHSRAFVTLLAFGTLFFWLNGKNAEAGRATSLAAMIAQPVHHLRLHSGGERSGEPGTLPSGGTSGTFCPVCTQEQFGGGLCGGETAPETCHDCKTPNGECYCVEGDYCDELTLCPNGQSDCPENTYCCLDTCCEKPVCLTPCGFVASGACCFEGFCELLSQSDCEVAGGAFSGDHTSCAPVITCPPDATITCGDSLSPEVLGMATADDNCDAEPEVKAKAIENYTTCLADPVRRHINRTWHAMNDSGADAVCLQAITELKVATKMDIRPGVCPNTYLPLSGGFIDIALVGTPEFNVSQVNLNSLRLSRADCIGGSLKPTMTTVADGASPFGGTPCDCHDLTGDGTNDLLLKFKRSGLLTVLLLQTMNPGDVVELALTGTMNDDCSFVAYDCVVYPGNPLQ